MVSWNGSQTLRLIELYRSRPVLWDPKDINRKNKLYRQEALMAISEELGVDKYELVRKIKNLTSHYFRERRKTDTLKMKGSLKPYKSKWFAFRPLDFLRCRNDPLFNYRISARQFQMPELEVDTSLSGTGTAAKENEDLYEIGELPVKCEVQTDDEEEAEMHDSVKVEPDGNQCSSVTMNDGRPEEHKDSEGGSEELAMINGLFGNGGKPSASSADWHLPNSSSYLRVGSLYERTDEYSLLGEEVALKVRKLPTNYARTFVQYKIQRLLFKAALGRYDYPASSAQKTEAVLLPTVDNNKSCNEISSEASISSPSSNASAAEDASPPSPRQDDPNSNGITNYQ